MNGKEICLEVTNAWQDLCFYFLYFERRESVGRIGLGEQMVIDIAEG